MCTSSNKGEIYRFYVETDRGTTSLRRIRLKMMGYVQLSLAPREVECTVLWSANSTRRMQHLMQAALDTRHPATAEKIFRFGVSHTEWSLEPARVLSPNGCPLKVHPQGSSQSCHVDQKTLKIKKLQIFRLPTAKIT
jgi:hypothetical protein